MSDNKKPIREQFDSAEEAAKFWDTHSLAEHWDETRKDGRIGLQSDAGGARDDPQVNRVVDRTKEEHPTRICAFQRNRREKTRLRP